MLLKLLPTIFVMSKQNVVMVFKGELMFSKKTKKKTVTTANQVSSRRC